MGRNLLNLLQLQERRGQKRSSILTTKKPSAFTKAVTCYLWLHDQAIGDRTCNIQEMIKVQTSFNEAFEELTTHEAALLAQLTEQICASDSKNSASSPNLDN